MRILILLAAGLLGATAACQAEEATTAPAAQQRLAEARKGVGPDLVREVRSNLPIDRPPHGVLELTSYASPVGPLAAYISPRPAKPGRYPALIWITGGDFNSIGDVWRAAPPENDQTAAAFRRPDMVLMYPSLRGGNLNPGMREGFYGEVDDVIAALHHLKSLDYVDPQRIYLAGHSTGGTLVMLVSEMTDAFRASFAFGPLADPAPYARMMGADFLPFDPGNARALALRSPKMWLHSVRTPLFVLEGDRSPGNAYDLADMKAATMNAKIRFLSAKGHDHFSILAPTTALLARKIVADTGATTAIALDEAVIAAKR